METVFTFKNIFLLIGAAQGIFLTVALLFIKKGNVRANYFLAFFILSFSLLSIGDFLTDSRLIVRVPALLLVFDPLIFILAPFCYFYVKSLTAEDWKFQSRHVWHFIPVLSVYALFSFIYLGDTQEKINLILEEYQHPDQSIDIFLIIAVVQILIYLIVAYRLLIIHAQRIKYYFSYQNSVSLNWLKNFLAINFFLWISFAFSTILKLKLVVDISDLLFPFAVYLIGYFELKQPAIFFYKTDEMNRDENDKNLSQKYASSSLTEDLAQQYLLKLLQIMKDENLYLKNDLKLIDVAEKLSIPIHHLSQVINDKLEKNFNDFVNEYRIEDLKKRLANPQYAHLTILAIGLDSGFNSKAAMNAVFKKQTGLSPSQYRTAHTNN